MQNGANQVNLSKHQLKKQLAQITHILQKSIILVDFVITIHLVIVAQTMTIRLKPKNNVQQNSQELIALVAHIKQLYR